MRDPDEQQRERLAHYYYEPGRPRVVIHLPAAADEPVVAEDLGLWVAQIMESTRSLTHAYNLAGSIRVHLRAGNDLAWQAAPPEAPAAATPAPAAEPETPRDAADRFKSWLKGQEEKEARERAELEERLAKHEAPAPGRRKSNKGRSINHPAPGQVEREAEAIHRYLLAQGREMRPIEIMRADLPGLADRSTVSNRLQLLEKQGRAVRRSGTAAERHSWKGRVVFWRALPPEGAPHGRNGAEPVAISAATEREAEEDAPYAQVVSWTKGKVMLFWGGQPPGSETKQCRTRELEERLQLKECRWLDGGDHGDLPQNQREIERRDVDFMVVTTYNTHHVTEQLARRAINRGIPVFRLGRTNAVVQVLHGLREQLFQRRELLLAA